MKNGFYCVALLLITACSLTQKNTGLIDIDPRELLLDTIDLPAECGYYLEDASDQEHIRNSVIIAEWPANEGQEYIDKTGRIDGWSVAYNCKNMNESLPIFVGDNAVLFQSVKGAQLLLDEILDYRSDEGYEELVVYPKIGDRTRAWMAYSDDGVYVYYVVDFSYRNISHGVSISGFDENTTLDFALSVARTLLAKMKKIPLSDGISYQQ